MTKETKSEVFRSSQIRSLISSGSSLAMLMSAGRDTEQMDLSKKRAKLVDQFQLKEALTQSYEENSSENLRYAGIKAISLTDQSHVTKFTQLKFSVA